MSGPRIGSMLWRLSTLQVGESFVVEVDIVQKTQSQISVEVQRLRKKTDWADAVFEQTVFYAINPSTREVLVVNRVKRTK